MLMLLALAMIGIPSSQAYVCYQCNSAINSDCFNPGSRNADVDTCTGDICVETKIESVGRYWMHLRVFIILTF